VASSSKETRPTPSPAGASAARPAEKAPPQLRHGVSTSTAIETDKLPDVGLLNDRALSLPGPAYPINWRKATTPVTVTVEVVIDETGRVIYSRAVEGPEGLWRVAEDAARQAGFLPFRPDRKPSKVKGLISYSFPFDPR
jgi:outer membrane biosynthesis protein TonB